MVITMLLQSCCYHCVYCLTLQSESLFALDLGNISMHRYVSVEVEVGDVEFLLQHAIMNLFKT